jgi:flagellar basal body-associated protein FliL
MPRLAPGSRGDERWNQPNGDLVSIVTILIIVLLVVLVLGFLGRGRFRA